MRILVHDYCGHPFQVELSRWLSRRGHKTLHLYSTTTQSPRGNLEILPGDASGFGIEGLTLSGPLQKYSLVKRRWQEIEYGKLLRDKVLSFAPEILISANTPLDAQNILWKACIRSHIPRIFWLQDIHGIAIQAILGRKLHWLGTLIAQHYARMEKELLRKSDAIVSISPDFTALLEGWGLPAERIYLIQNWSPLEDLPVFPKRNDWSAANSLQDSFTFLYSGTLGFKHNPEILLQLARHYQGKPTVKVVVISEGPGADWIRQQKNDLCLDNLTVMDFQPFSLMPMVLASADVLVGILEPTAGVCSVPSKVLTYLCAGKPVLLSVPPENLAARIVSSISAGMVTTDSDRFLAAADELYNDANLRVVMGRNGMDYAREHFNIEGIGIQFERIFEECRKKVL